MSIRAARGATTVPENTRTAILQAAREMLEAIAEANHITPEKVISAVFTATPDLDAAYPAEAARGLGWRRAGLLCIQEMAVAGSLPMCLRVMVLWESERPQDRVRHCYLRGASNLRPDLAQEGPD